MNLSASASSLYCERGTPGFWAEPLNAGTSLLVIIVAIIGFIQLWRQNLLSPTVIVMMVLACLIGVGSFLLHTFATVWSEIVDVLPIWAFVVFYGLAVTRRIEMGPLNPVVVAVFGFGVLAGGVALGMGAQMSVPIFASGSMQYVPATLMIISVLWFLWRGRHPAMPQMSVGVGIFLVALTLRSLDQWLCSSVPTGTHFLWHLSNCLVFWLLIRAYAVHEAMLSRSVPDTTGRSGPVRDHS